MVDRMGEKLSTTEASGLLAWHLAHGEAISNEQAVELTGLQLETVRQMLCRLSRVIPIYQTELWFWQVICLKEAE